MGIITRPLKPIGGGGGSDWIADAFLDADEFNAESDTIYDEFNGLIDNSNIKPLAAIEGTKIASKPNGVGTDQINAKAVTSVELANDAATDALRAVGSDHIKDDAIIARTLKFSEYTQAPVVGLNSNEGFNMATGLIATNIIPLSFQLERATGPAGIIGVAIANKLTLHLWKDTNDDQLYLVIFNNNTIVVNLNGEITVKLTYVPAA